MSDCEEPTECANTERVMAAPTVSACPAPRSDAQLVRTFEARCTMTPPVLCRGELNAAMPDAAPTLGWSQGSAGRRLRQWANNVRRWFRVHPTAVLAPASPRLDAFLGTERVVAKGTWSAAWWSSGRLVSSTSGQLAHGGRRSSFLQRSAACSLTVGMILANETVWQSYMQISLCLNSKLIAFGDSGTAVLTACV